MRETAGAVTTGERRREKERERERERERDGNGDNATRDEYGPVLVVAEKVFGGTPDECVAGVECNGVL